ncbi:MAG TPA: hypothetical protein VF608_02320 [Thermoanaerobaculia bacterium]
MLNRRRWLWVATIGCALVCMTMIVVALVLIDKPHFGFLVNQYFTPIVGCGVFVGGAMVLIAAFMLPERKTWRGITLIVWSLIALTSPAFGFLFLLPWGVLVAALPLVIMILTRLWRV